MRYQITGVLSFLLLLTTIVPIAQAETMEVTPFQLISLAQDGYLEDQGIPKGSLLFEEYQSGRVTAEELIQAAVKDKRLMEDTLNDQGYLNAVTQEIQEIINSDSSGH
ncbi:hypothetical protein IFO70_24265 [Phormidium tenue FACHB-886]|nr:hypothetical protein [Phormidium tenue FACHB-886]